MLQEGCVRAQSLGFRSYRLRGVFQCGGKAQHEEKRRLGLILAGNLSAMVAHHAVDGAQTQASALADRLRGVERIEDAKRLFQAGPLSENCTITSSP